MITKKQYDDARTSALEYYAKASIVLTEDEAANVEVADFGLSRLNDIGLQLVTYVNTENCCAKEMVLFPYQTCPEHRHPDGEGYAGKEETFRCRWGQALLYVEGEKTPEISGKIPQGREEHFTVFHEIILNPGDQYTIYPNTLHWFQAGASGAVISEFSTKSRDESDIFTDPGIERATIIGD